MIFCFSMVYRLCFGLIRFPKWFSYRCGYQLPFFYWLEAHGQQQFREKQFHIIGRESFSPSFKLLSSKMSCAQAHQHQEMGLATLREYHIFVPPDYSKVVILSLVCLNSYLKLGMLKPRWHCWRQLC